MKLKISTRNIYYLDLIVYLLVMIFLGANWSEQHLWIVSPLRIMSRYIVIILSLFLILRRILLHIDNRNTAIANIFIILAVYASNVVTQNNLLCLSTLIILASVEVEFDSILRIYIRCMVIFLVGIVLAYSLHLTISTKTISVYSVRNSVGMAHPNNFAVIIMSLAMALICFNKKKSNFFNWVVAIVTAYLIWSITGSRTSLIGIILFIVLLTIRKNIKIVSSKNMHGHFLKVLFIASMVVAVYLMFNSSEMWADVNFVARFSSAYQLFEKYGIKVFGSNITFVSSSQASLLGVAPVILDSAFLALVLYYGILVTIVYISFFNKGIVKAISNDNDCILIVFVVFIMHGFMEQSMLSPCYNFALLYIYSLAYKNEVCQ